MNKDEAVRDLMKTTRNIILCAIAGGMFLAFLIVDASGNGVHVSSKLADIAFDIACLVGYSILTFDQLKTMRQKFYLYLASQNLHNIDKENNYETTQR